MPFVHDVALRFSDADLLGHVNHAKFLTYVEDARIALLGQVPGEGPSLAAGGVILAHADMDYLAPLLLSAEPVRVTLTLQRMGTSSVSLGHELVQDGTVAARGSVVVVSYDYQAERARPLTDDERSALQRLAGA